MRQLWVPARGHDGDRRNRGSRMRDDQPMRWVIWFYLILPRRARPIYVAIMLLFVWALLSDG